MWAPAGVSICAVRIRVVPPRIASHKHCPVKVVGWGLTKWTDGITELERALHAAQKGPLTGLKRTLLSCALAGRPRSPGTGNCGTGLVLGVTTCGFLGQGTDASCHSPPLRKPVRLSYAAFFSLSVHCGTLCPGTPQA